MGTFQIQSNLDKISRKSSATTKQAVGATSLGFCLALLLVGNAHIAHAKSLSISHKSIGDNVSISTTKLPPTTTLPSFIQHTVELDVEKDPEVTWVMGKDARPFHFTISSESNALFRMAIHLKECDFETGDYIEIKVRDEEKREKWWCPKKTITSDADASFSSYDFVDEYKLEGVHTTSSEKHSGDKSVTALEVMDDLKEVWIIPHMNQSRVGKREKWSKKVKATLIINLYRDIPGSNSCPDELFDCHQALCPTTCCSDVSSGSGSSSHQAKSATGEPSSTFTSSVWGTKSSERSRCIPKALKCNDNPNCGMPINIDERNQICHPEKYCTCQSVCLTWNYVLTSLAIAILFIITPTAIVFALFHRRNVALERARLIRLAQARMADLRGDFTRDGPTNDVPPSYDEVYDIKEPPPCFCKALAMQKEHDLQQQRESSTEDPATDAAVQIDGGESDSIEFQNAGFQCSCVNVSGEDDDIPPSYGDVRRGGNGVDAGSDAEHHRRNGDAPNTTPVEATEFENVDLEKEEDV